MISTTFVNLRFHLRYFKIFFQSFNLFILQILISFPASEMHILEDYLSYIWLFIELTCFNSFC